MKDFNSLDRDSSLKSTLSLQDFLRMGFLQLRVIFVTFVLVLAAVVLYVGVKEDTYEAKMKILLRKERMDPFVTPEDKPPAEILQRITLEQDLNAEIQILKSHDLLEKVVLELNLHEPRNESKLDMLRRRLSEALGSKPTRERNIAKAIVELERKLTVEPLEKSNLIEVSYSSTDPQQAARVLSTLSSLYLEKHLAVHRPTGMTAFFQQEAERYRDKLDLAERQLMQFDREEGIVSPELQKEIVAKKLGDFEGGLQETLAEIRSVQQRIQTLAARTAASEPRMTTTRKTTVGWHSEQLQSTLVNLLLKRIELLRMYQPDYPLVLDVDAQIEAAEAAIKAERETPLVEEATDQDPTFEWSRSELAKAGTELEGLKSKADALAQTVNTYRDKAIQLDRMELVHKDLLRDYNLVEQSYSVHFKKQEEARIADALDGRRIVNVTIMDPPTIPYLPLGLPRWQILILGCVAALLLSGLAGLISDRWDPSFRTPRELEELLEIPVAAAIPKMG